MKPAYSLNWRRGPVLATALCLGLAGCAVGPDFVKPQAPAVQSFVRPQDGHILSGLGAGDQAIKEQWWHDYQSDAMNEIVELALKNNPNIDAAIANLKAAQANVRVQQGFFFPTIGAGYVGTQGNPGYTIAPPTNTDIGSVYALQTAQLTIGYMPDIFGLNRRQVESLQAQAKISQFQLDALRITVASNVIAAVMQEAALSEQFAAQQRAVQLAQGQLKTARKMFAEGYYSRVDLANQESAYTAAQQALLGYRKALDQTRDLLAILCGKFPSEEIVRVKLEAIRVPERLPSAIPSRLVEQRPDVMAAEQLVKSANAQIGVAIASMLPQFTIFGVIGGAASAFNAMFNGDNVFWAATGAVGQTLFDGGTLYFRKQAAEAVTAEALAQYKAAVIAAYQNVADTLYALDVDKQTLLSAIDNEQALEAIQSATQKQFDTGYASEPANQLAQQNFLNARTARVQAQVTYMGDTVALYQALGGGWAGESAPATAQVASK